MRKTQETLKRKHSTKQAVLYTAFELGNSTWKLAFSNGSKVRYVSTGARNVHQLQGNLALAKKRLGLSAEVKVVSCYEAGRDGFWFGL